MNLSINEKRTIFQILVLIMKADDVIKPEEMTFLDGIFKEFHLSIDEFDHMEEMEIDYLRKDFSFFSDETKDYAKQLFIEMSKCDGFVDPRETLLIENFF